MSPAPDHDACRDLPDLCRVAVARFRLIALTAIAFAALAVVITSIRGRVHEATAFLEIDDPAEVTTIEEKLRFPSLYRRVTENAADLQQRTRVKARRGSRIIAVTVTHADAPTAAREADAVARAFLEPADSLSVASLPEPDEADSPESLAKAWRAQSAEYEKLSARYDHDATHPAVKGAAERLAAFRDRLTKQLAAYDADDTRPLEARLETLIASRQPGPATAPGARLVESATVPRDPAGPRPALVWLAALILGALAGFIAALCGPYRVECSTQHG